MMIALLLLTSTLWAQSLQHARMARGDDPRWADPAFDDSHWTTVGRRQPRPMQDATENRLWLRMRVTLPAQEPAAVWVFRCPCEMFLDGVRLGATGNLNLPRPDASGEVHVFPIPPSFAGRSALLAVRQYHAPGIGAATGFPGWLQVRIVPVRGIGGGVERIRWTIMSPYWIRFGVLLLARS